MKDYYLEYLEELERSLKEDMARLDGRTLMAGPYSMRRPLLNYLWCSMLKGRDEYNTLRRGGATRAEAIAGWRLGEIRIGREFKRQVTEMKEHPWYKALRGLRGRTVFFCSGKRNVEYMRPVIERYEGEAVVLTDADCSGEAWPSARKAVVGLELARLCFYESPFLEQETPHFFAYVNTLLMLMEALEPARVVVNDGCQTKYMIVGEYCRTAGKRAVCIQQGWPSIVHAGFRELPYSEFLTWGEGYGPLLGAHNEGMRMRACGYAYEVKDGGEERRGIGFFLQEKLFIADERSERMMEETIVRMAEKYEDRPIYVRRHPLCRQEGGWIVGEGLRNVVIADGMPIEEMMMRCHVAVSHFSSCIMESAIHGCIPVVLDPASGSRYNPDIEKEWLGYITTNPEEAEAAIEAALKRRCACHRGKWCEATGAEAAERICRAIEGEEI